jgi:hypothetical protein
LLEPIVKSNRLADLTDEEEHWYIFKCKVTKLFRMAEQYGINLATNPPNWTSWALLAMRLAEELGHPGFQVVGSYREIPRGPGRPPNSGGIDRFLLRREVDQLRADASGRGDKMTISAACKLLSKPKAKTTKKFKNWPPESLETAYHKACKEVSVMEEEMRGLSA